MQALEEKIATLEKRIDDQEEQIAFRDGQIDGLREIEEDKDEKIKELVWKNIPTDYFA